MLSHIAEWAVAVLAGGVIAGLVVVAAAAAGGWLLYRWVRRRLDAAVLVATYARHRAAGAVAGGGCGCRRGWCTICAGASTGRPTCGEPRCRGG